jgi:hypothetical protein
MMDGPSIKDEGVLWGRTDAPLRTFYTDNDGVDHDLTHLCLRDAVVKAAKKCVDEYEDQEDAMGLYELIGDVAITVEALLAAERRIDGASTPT